MSTFNQEPAKGLDRNFDSFADAVAAYMALPGIEETKNIDEDLVRTFCRCLKIECVSENTGKTLKSHHYFPETQWVKDYLEKHHFFPIGNGTFFKVDAGNRPIARVDLNWDPKTNIAIFYDGDAQYAEELGELINSNLKADEIEEAKPFYYELKISTGMMFSGPEGSIVANRESVDNVRIADPAYYPYLEGGIIPLIKDFIASDENVLILMGLPGTGKSSGISAGISALGLMPIYAKKTEVVKHKNFVETVFSLSDKYMEMIAGSKIRERGLLFKERAFLQECFPNYFSPRDIFLPTETSSDDKVLIPIVVVEDADILLRPRDQGNEAMAELLNCTDGVGSNYSRKIIFTSNLENTDNIDKALIRPGRCYGVFNFRHLTPMEAIEARSACGLPPFVTAPKEDISLAEALRQPRKKIFFEDGAPVLKANIQH